MEFNIEIEINKCLQGAGQWHLRTMNMLKIVSITIFTQILKMLVILPERYLILVIFSQWTLIVRFWRYFFQIDLITRAFNRLVTPTTSPQKTLQVVTKGHIRCFEDAFMERIAMNTCLTMQLNLLQHTRINQLCWISISLISMSQPTMFYHM